MRQKMELIQEIRAMEARPVNRIKLVNLSETAGHGLLSEMSIAEVGTHAKSILFIESKNTKDSNSILLIGDFHDLSMRVIET